MTTKRVGLARVPLWRVLDYLTKDPSPEHQVNCPVVYQVVDAEFAQLINTSLHTVFDHVRSDHIHVSREDDEYEALERARISDVERKSYRPDLLKPKVRFFRKVKSSKPLVVQDDQKQVVFHQLENTNDQICRPEYVTYVFPGSLPVSLMQENIQELYTMDFFYYLTLKTNGVRMIMMIGTWWGQKLVVLYDRGHHIYIVPIRCPDVMFDGTVLDGDLVQLQDPKTHQYLPGQYSFRVFNCLYSCGVPCAQRTLFHRLQIGSLLVRMWSECFQQKNESQQIGNKRKRLDQNTIVKRTKMEWGYQANQVCDVEGGAPFTIAMKEYYPIQRAFELFMDVLPNLSEPTDGNVVNAIEAIDVGKRTASQKKIKKFTDHTIDLATEVVMRDMDVELNFFIMDEVKEGRDKPWIWWSQTKIDLNDSEPFFQKLKIHQWTELHNQIVECEYNKKLQRWEPRLVRWNDKPTPNLINTALMTWFGWLHSLRLETMFWKGSMPDSSRNALKQLDKLADECQTWEEWVHKIQTFKLSPEEESRVRYDLQCLKPTVTVLPLTLEQINSNTRK